MSPSLQNFRVGIKWFVSSNLDHCQTQAVIKGVRGCIELLTEIPRVPYGFTPR